MSNQGYIKVFQVEHSQGSEDELELVDNYKTIGICSTEAKAHAAIARAQLLPGFRDHPECFGIGVYMLDFDYWNEGFMDMTDEVQELPEPQ